MDECIDVCIKYKTARLEAQRETNNSHDLFHNFFDIQYLPTSGLMNSDRFCDQILQIVIAGNLSFSQAENPELVALLKNAYPTCKIPNHHLIAAQLKVVAKEEQQRLKLMLKENDFKVSLALDAWTACRCCSAFDGYGSPF